MKKGKKKLIIGGAIIFIFAIIIILAIYCKEEITEFFKNGGSDNYLATGTLKYVKLEQVGSVDKISLRESKYVVEDRSNVGWCLMKNAGLYGIGYEGRRIDYNR